jgi:DNA repair/transcription protein MET18/MMS19
MLQSLQLPDAKMRANLIDSLTGIMESADSSSDAAIHDQAKTLVLALLTIATGADDASCDEVGLRQVGYRVCFASLTRFDAQRCRIAALRCLSVFPDVVRFEALQNVKSTVIRGLARALDDPKRMVRRQAVDSRARW